MQKRTRDNFDAVRLIAAMVVVYGHAYPLTMTPSLSILGTSIEGMSVKVFFIISGFLVTKSWLSDPSPFRYFARRALRILPGLAIVVLLSILLLGSTVTTLPVGTYIKQPATWRYLTNIAFEPNYFLPGVFASNPYPNAVNGSLWSLPVEVAMYILMPILCVSLRWSRLTLLIGTLVLCAASLHYLRSGAPAPRVVIYGTDWVGALDAMPFFFLGAVAQTCIGEKLFNVQIALVLALLSTAVPAVPAAQEICLYVMLPYLVISLATAKPASLGHFGRFGDVSYGVYIYGFPCQQLVSRLLDDQHRPLLNFSLSAPLTLILAWLSWHAIEKRFLLLKPRPSMPLEPGLPPTAKAA